MFGLMIILAMVFFGGLLAFLGDRVGMKVGKKRLSLFGIRPKYTSMIITVLTGFFIAGLTLLILTFLSEYARNAIFRLNIIQDELKVTTAKVSQLLDQKSQAEAEYRVLTNKYQELQTALQDVIVQRKKKEEQLREIQTQYGKVKQDLNMTTEELALAQKRSENLGRINQEYQNEITDLNLQAERLNQQIQNLEGWLKSLEDRHQTIVGKPIIFYVGEILVARVTDPDVPEDKIFNQLVEPILNEVNDVALKRGAKIPGKKDYAVRIAPQRVDQICQELSWLKTKAVLRSVVEKNSVAGEPLTVTLELYPDKMIYKSGEVISSTKLSGATSESELRDELLSLLVIAINKAIEKGIITNGQNLRNVISVSEIARVIGQIKGNNNDQYNVSVVAMEDLYRTNPFKVRLEYVKI